MNPFSEKNPHTHCSGPGHKHRSLGHLLFTNSVEGSLTSPTNCDREGQKQENNTSYDVTYQWKSFLWFLCNQSLFLGAFKSTIVTLIKLEPKTRSLGIQQTRNKHLFLSNKLPMLLVQMLRLLNYSYNSSIVKTLFLKFRKWAKSVFYRLYIFSFQARMVRCFSVMITYQFS